MAAATVAVADIYRRLNLSRVDHNSCLSASLFLLRFDILEQNGEEGIVRVVRKRKRIRCCDCAFVVVSGFVSVPL